jgi:uncharacterized protein (TIGR03437 family)
MKATLTLAGLCVLVLAPAVSAAPQIAAILNAASYSLPGLPNSAIAPGSMLVVFGTELGPAGLQQANGFPYPTTLGGTSIRITVGATSVDAIVVYTSATQVAAILPSITPAGIGLLAVTYQGRTSQSGAFRISKSAPGILTQNQAGSGLALVQNFNSETDQPRNGLTRAAHPGQVVTLWATGLGPIAGDDSVAPVPQDLNLNLQVLVGGKPAKVRYKGRSGCCAGVDQIVFEIPPGVEGCYVPIVVRVDDAISNFATLSVASTGDICSDLSGASGADLEKLQGGGQVASGSISLSVSLDCDDYNPCMYVEFGSASFVRSSFLSSALLSGLPSPGSCLVLSGRNQLRVGIFRAADALDAGPMLNLSGPKGTRQITARSPGFYSEEFSVAAGQVQYLEPGNYVIDNGPGGADVGPFRATLTVPKTFTSAVQRSTAAVKVVWSGGDPSSVAIIQGAGVPAANGATAGFVCTERVGAGQFTIPAEALLSLPPDSADHADLMVSATSPAVTIFRAPGLDIGQFSFISSPQ